MKEIIRTDKFNIWGDKEEFSLELDSKIKEVFIKVGGKINVSSANEGSIVYCKKGSGSVMENSFNTKKEIPKKICQFPITNRTANISKEGRFISVYNFFDFCDCLCC